MTGYEFGDIVLVPFPFSDLTAVKKRPAVVVSSRDYGSRRPDLLILAIASQVGAFPTVLEAACKVERGWSAQAVGAQARAGNHREKPRHPPIGTPGGV